MILGVICGLSSALQTRLSIMMFKLRKSVEWMRTSWGRVLDVVVLACITAFVYATLPQILGKCVHESAYDDDHRRLSVSSDNRSFWVWTCDGEYEYNEMASMSLSGSEGVIQHLFARDNENFGVIPTMTMFLCYFPLAVLVIGTAVPAGTFVPSLMLGGLMGRLVGELCGHIHGTGGKAVSTAGVYAEIGAGAMLGGWTRTMIAICVLMAEITGDVSLTIPLIISVKIARQVAEYYEPEGLTHALMHLSGMDAHDSLTPVLWVDPVDQAAADAATKATMESLGLDSSLDYADMEIEDEEEAQNAEEPEKEDPDRRRTLKRRPSTTFM
jgi:H+/Cl- antiporter ClcA